MITATITVAATVEHPIYGEHSFLVGDPLPETSPFFFPMINAGWATYDGIGSEYQLLKVYAPQNPDDGSTLVWDSSVHAFVPKVLGFGFPYTFDPTLARLASDVTGVRGINAGFYNRVQGRGLISKIGLYVTTASGNISVSVNRNLGDGRNAVPDTRVATSGVIASPAIGYAEISLDVPVMVEEGDWFGLSADVTAFRCASQLGVLGVVNLGLGRQYSQLTGSHPLPLQPSALSAQVGSNALMVGVA